MLALCSIQVTSRGPCSTLKGCWSIDAMGIRDLHQVLSSLERNCSVEVFKNLRVGIDGHGWLYRSAARTFKSYNDGLPQSVDGLQQPPSKDIIQAALDFFVAEIQKILYHADKVVLVFDGERMPIKNNKKYSNKNRTRVKVTKYMNKMLSLHLEREFLGQKRFEILHAPFEADAQLGYLYRNKFIDVAISEDYDLLCYGCLHIVSKYARGGDGVLIDGRYLYACDWKPNVDFSSWTESMFLTFCILCGCDFLDRLQSVGPVKAYDAVQTYDDNIEAILINWTETGAVKNIPLSYLFDFTRSRLTFLHAVVVNENNELVHLTEVPAKDLKLVGSYLGTIA